MSVMMMENLGHLLIEFVQNIFHIVKRFARYKETKLLYIELWPIKLWSQYQYIVIISFGVLVYHMFFVCQTKNSQDIEQTYWPTNQLAVAN